ncbi:MAG: hypothetical protein PHF86_00050 [Candidatus Nanoarchaeia archaeon]|nr:hypothetical protein [Candidatus Nanoarchaeia archaeon]
MKKYEELSEAEKALRTLIFAVETKDLHNKNHPMPLGEAYLKVKLADCKEIAAKLEIPLVPIDSNEYYAESHSDQVIDQMNTEEEIKEAAKEYFDSLCINQKSYLYPTKGFIAGVKSKIAMIYCLNKIKHGYF